ncbi:Crp/Fnr family transcriptional regulator [Kordia sp.]|uniref:Crp/Fnr family transcriptional regulator n=1 Tax=Kordia sp. TaxID=1965332 RepID=UPI0025C2BD01|nr:Crp/Fnr family transcriptional regulator [Kordia sp.]MCH2195439.1 Crp/Fnr family transcriptional regulator [Kordia sp.]
MSTEFQDIKSHITNLIQMNEEVFNLALGHFTLKHIKKGDYLVTEGTIAKHIAYIRKGLFRTFYLKDGNEVNTCFCMENSMTTSHESFVNKKASTEYIQALEDATIISLSHESLLSLYESNSEWVELSRLLTEVECARLTERIKALSFETAKEKYLHLLTSQPKVIQRVSIQHIASYIGVSRETLSRVRSQISQLQ